MGELVTLLGQHLEEHPPTVVIQATTWQEEVLALVKLQECGLGVHLPVKVCCYCYASVQNKQAFSSINLCKLKTDPFFIYVDMCKNNN